MKKDKVQLKGLGKGAPYVMPSKSLKGFSSYRKGYKAAKKGLPTTACPYQLTDEIRSLLVKRDRWMKGHEDFAWSQKGSRMQHKRIAREKKEAREKKRKKA